MTQHELADRIGVNVKMISFYENGRSLPTVETLKKMSKVLGVSTDLLLDMKNFKE